MEEVIIITSKQSCNKTRQFGIVHLIVNKALRVIIERFYFWMVLPTLKKKIVKEVTIITSKQPCNKIRQFGIVHLKP